MDFATNGRVTVPTTIPTVVGGLQLAPARPGAAVLHQRVEIPSNINDVFIVPKNTVPEPGANMPNAGAGDFDCFEPMATITPRRVSWSSSTSPNSRPGAGVSSPRTASNGAPQSLFQKAGNDGFYWVLGITVTKSTAAKVYWTFPIYQNSETV